MEAWKFFNYTSLLSLPLYALAPTAVRWGLEAFPANIIATPDHLDKLVTNGSVVEQAWAVPYTCADNISSWNLEPIPSQEQDDSRFSNPYTNVSSSNICSTPEACPASGCLIVVEGVGKTRIGPAQSNIVKLVHGISIIISLLAASGLFIMVERLSSIFRKKSKNPKNPENPAGPVNGLNGRDIGNGYNPPEQEERRVRPPIYANGYREDEETAAAKAKSIMRCSDLLRRKYELDIEIWGCGPDEESRRRQLQRRSDALFREVHRSVAYWRASSHMGWTAEEWKHIERICQIVDAHAYTEGMI